jgi:hypothetical protein
MSETKWAQWIVDTARDNGWLVYRTWNSRHSVAGFPDLVLVKRRWLIFAELKSETGKLTQPQTRWLTALQEAAMPEVFVWRPSDRALVLNALCR